MINDEQIAELIANYEAPAHIWKDDVTFAREYAFEFARSLVALAQQVRPLDFKNDDYGNKFALTSYGEYWLYPPEQAHEPWLLTTACGSESEYSSEEYAVEVAQDIHKAKILRELMHGGGE